jgi:hypothetical protein
MHTHAPIRTLQYPRKPEGKGFLDYFTSSGSGYLRPLFCASKVFLGAGASFSCPGCNLMWIQYSEFVIGFLQTGQLHNRTWMPYKARMYIVKLHMLHFSKVILRVPPAISMLYVSVELGGTNNYYYFAWTTTRRRLICADICRPAHRAIFARSPGQAF